MSPENVGIAINDGKIDVKDAASLQIIYLIDQEGKYCFDLKIKGQLELIETYDFKVPASLVKNIEVLQNSNILNYPASNILSSPHPSVSIYSLHHSYNKNNPA